VQYVEGVSGLLMVPSRTVVGKHSRSVAVSVGDFFQVYIKHDSPFRHVCVMEMLVGLNSSHFASGLSRLPQEKHCRPVLSG